MPKKVTIEYAHGMQDTVCIKAINVNGRITAMSTDIHGEMYQVVYWDDGVRQCVWVHDWEISEA